MHGVPKPILLVLEAPVGAYNSFTSSATGLSPFQCVYDYQPPLFPAMERKVSCPSSQAFARHHPPALAGVLCSYICNKAFRLPLFTARLPFEVALALQDLCDLCHFMCKSHFNMRSQSSALLTQHTNLSMRALSKKVPNLQEDASFLSLAMYSFMDSSSLWFRGLNFYLSAMKFIFGTKCALSKSINSDNFFLTVSMAHTSP